MLVKYLSAIASVAICLLPEIGFSQEQQNYACFFTNESGRTVDFS